MVNCASEKTHYLSITEKLGLINTRLTLRVRVRRYMRYRFVIAISAVADKKAIIEDENLSLNLSGGESEVFGKISMVNGESDTRMLKDSKIFYLGRIRRATPVVNFESKLKESGVDKWPEIDVQPTMANNAVYVTLRSVYSTVCLSLIACPLTMRLAALANDDLFSL